MSNVQDARREMTKTKEQLEEEKKISLSIRIKPLELDGKILLELDGPMG
jgi:troponin T